MFKELIVNNNNSKYHCYNVKLQRFGSISYPFAEERIFCEKIICYESEIDINNLHKVYIVYSNCWFELNLSSYKPVNCKCAIECVEFYITPVPCKPMVKNV